MSQGKLRPSGRVFGIYYPDFYVPDEYLASYRFSWERTPEHKLLEHKNRLANLLLCNDVVQIPMDNFVFSPTNTLVEVRRAFLNDNTIQYYMDNGYVITTEHGILDRRSSLELHRSRLASTGFRIGTLSSRVEDKLILRLASQKSPIVAQVTTFKHLIEDIVENMRVLMSDDVRTVEEIIKHSYEAYGDDDISAEYIIEKVIISNLNDNLKNRLIVHIRRAFNRSFAPLEGFNWYSDTLTELDIPPLGTTYEQPNPFLFSPTFIQLWMMGNFVPIPEWKLFLARSSDVFDVLRESYFNSEWLDFKECYHTEFVPDLDAVITNEFYSTNRLKDKFNVDSSTALLLQDVVLGAASYGLSWFSIIVPFVRAVLKEVVIGPKINNVLANSKWRPIRDFIPILRTAIDQVAKSA